MRVFDIFHLTKYQTKNEKKNEIQKFQEIKEKNIKQKIDINRVYKKQNNKKKNENKKDKKLFSVRIRLKKKSTQHNKWNAMKQFYNKKKLNIYLK